MAVIRRFIHTATNSLSEPVQQCLIEIDTEIVGTIEKSNGDRFYVKTKGLVPTIDMISGRSFNDVWAKVAEQVRLGGVYYTKLITGTGPEGT